jgi:hypothetical protein
MDRIDTPITKPFHIFEFSCLFWKAFHNHRWTKWIFFALNNFKNYGNAIWSFTKPFWNAETIKWHPKILSSRIQTSHMCQSSSCLWPPSLGKCISCSFLCWLEQFFLHWIHHLKFYKTFLNTKTIEWLPNILSFRMQTSHMCQPTSC